jgi:hypothetical protein
VHEDLEADWIAFATIFVLGLPVLGIFLLPVFIVAMLEAVGIHNKVQLLFGSGYIAAAVPGLKLLIGIFAILALLDQLLQLVCVRLADNLEALVKILLGPIVCGGQGKTVILCPVSNTPALSAVGERRGELQTATRLTNNEMTN